MQTMEGFVVTEETATRTVDYDAGPVLPFHRRLVLSASSGSFSDGYVLGVTGIALAVATDTMDISDTWQGLLGSSTLAGLFFGALICGRLVDRFGRQPFYGPLMLIFTLVSLLQLLTSPDWSLLIVRFIMGLLLGGDYVSSKALLAEVSPRHWRGRALGALGFAWTLGFAAAYIVGLLMRDLGPDSWKWILATSAIPSIISFALRIGAPESPRWLVQNGRVAEARKIVTSRMGANYNLPETAPKSVEPSLRALFRSDTARSTFIACLVYTVAVMPTFALGTFLPRVVETLGVENPYTGSLGYYYCAAIGPFLGLLVIDRLSRRTMAFGGFIVSGLLLLPLMISGASPLFIVIVFATFALVTKATSTVGYVYPSELFSTELRGRGVGLAVASSRFGASALTFFMPIVVGNFGVVAALAMCVAVLLAGGVVGYIWAPETSSRALDPAASS
ncbi:MFS transporter [Rhodococcus sp. ACS1]|uniref:MFS transporter n=1 Tax=Rhodococcus sp. ACS1 TaxID=2028570 RepID=UPI001C52D909|nr:MFS transporter [Rhodococcus sp. ACS1]